MNFLKVIGVFALFMFIGIHALEYSLLEELEVPCLTRAHCNLVEKHGTSFEDRSCECDSQCNIFRDCCINKANLVPLQSSSTRKYSCLTFGDEKKVSVYVVDTCPENFRDSTAIRNLCEKSNDFTDPLASAPVTMVSTGKTFKNRYCAECNGASPSSLETWLVYLNCETPTPFQLNDSYIWQNVKYNLSLRTWGVEIGDKFHGCELLFDKPEHLSEVRFCRASTINSCPSSYPRASIKRLCESYSAVMYDRENSYKNPHCAICNNKRVEDLTCLDSVLFGRSAKVRFPFSVALLLDVDHINGSIVSISKAPVECPEGHRYDPFFKKCRQLVCALPGYKLVDRKCRKQ